MKKKLRRSVTEKKNEDAQNVRKGNGENVRNTTEAQVRMGDRE